MPGSGDQRASPIGSLRSSGAVTNSAALGTNCAAIGSSGSPGSISDATSSVSATAKRSATRRISSSRSGAARPAETRSWARKLKREILKDHDDRSGGHHSGQIRPPPAGLAAARYSTGPNSPREQPEKPGRERQERAERQGRAGAEPDAG